MTKCFSYLAIALVFTSFATADDAKFVGILDLARQEDVAKEIGLSSETRDDLIALIDERIKAAEKVVLDTPADKYETVIARFVAESEQMGLALLDDDQKMKLNQVRIARAGFITLAEPGVATQVGLSDEQKAAVAKLVAELKEELTKGGEQEQSVAKARYERKFGEVLNVAQRVSWNLLAGQTPDEIAADDPPKDDEPKDDEPKGDDPDPKDVADGGKPPAAADGKLQFNFQYTPWEPVLEWFAEQAGYSLQMTAPPLGTFNFSDSSEYSPPEALDRINSVLLTQGYTMLRNGKLLIMVDLAEDGIPPALVEIVKEDDLEKRGRYEIMKCLYTLEHAVLEDAEADIQPLVSEDDTSFVHVIPGAKQIVVQDWGGNLRLIKDVLDAADAEAKKTAVEVRSKDLEWVTTEELLTFARPLLGIGEDELNTEDGSLTLSPDPLGSRIFYAGVPEMLDRFEMVIKAADVDPKLDDTEPPIPGVKIYDTSKVDPETVLDVVKVILAGFPDVRATMDPKTGNLIIFATPDNHAKVGELLAKMQLETVDFEIVQLYRSDPATIMMMLDTFFEKDTAEEGMVRGPVYTGDEISNQLLIRGTKAEITAVKAIVAKVDPDTTSGDFPREPIRSIPFQGGGLESLFLEADLIMGHRRPGIRINRVNAGQNRRTLPARGQLGTEPDETDRPAEPKKEAAPEKRTDADIRPTKPATFRKSVRRPSGLRVHFVSEPIARADDEGGNQRPPEIRVTITETGIILESDDLDALDAYEQIVRDLINQRGEGSVLPTIFYLKHVTAEYAKATLDSYMGSGGGGGGGGGGGLGGLVGGLASNVIGGAAGDLVGGLFGGGGGGSTLTSGAFNIVAEPRLRAIIVSGSFEELALVEALLAEIDQSGPPGPIEEARTEIVQVNYTTADILVEVIRQSYPNEIVGTGGNQQQRQPSPQEFLQALSRGGRGGGGGGGGGSQAAEMPKMAITVDQGSNSIVVTGLDYQIAKVEDLVARLDRPELLASGDGIAVFPIPGNVNAELLKSGLESILGDKIEATTSSSTGSNISSSSPSTPSGQPNFDEIRRRIEAFRQGGGGGGTPTPSGDRGGSATPGSGRGGFTPGGGRGGFTPGGGGGGGRGGR